MAAHHDYSGLPKTWPFTFGSCLILLSMVWFTMGFALEDVGSELPAFFPIFWLLIAVGIVIMLVGAVYNIRSRKHQTA